MTSRSVLTTETVVFRFLTRFRSPRDSSAEPFDDEAPPILPAQTRTIEELLEAIDERTLLVPISHVLFRSSAMYDAKRVIDRAHEKGAMVLLDCYQSAGTVPLALKEWNVDMACGGSVGEVQTDQGLVGIEAAAGATP